MVSIRDRLITLGATGAIPAGTQTGDLLVAFGLVNGSNGGPQAPGTSWGTIITGGSLFTGFRVAQRIADGSFTPVGMANADSITVVSLKDFDPANPIGAANTSANGSDLTVELPTLAQVYAPSFILALALHRNATALAPTAASAALVESMDVSGSGTAQVGLYYLDNAEAFSGYVIRATGSNSQSRGIAVEIKPSAVTPPPSIPAKGSFAPYFS